MSITEKDFQYECQQAFKLFNCGYHKVPDSPPAFARPCERCSHTGKAQYRFTPPKPYDAYVIYQKVHFSFEYKLHKVHTAFPFNKLEPHQEKALIEDQENGARSFVVINIRDQEKRLNFIVCYNILDFVALRYECSVSKPSRKSVPRDELIKGGVLISRKHFKGRDGLYFEFENWMKTELEKVEVF